MEVKWLLAFLVLMVFISGCLDFDGDDIEPEFSDNALDMNFEVIEELQEKKILPGQTIRLVVYLKNQVDSATANVEVIISDPYGLEATRVTCNPNCACEGQIPIGCGSDVSCTFNSCSFDSIQSDDEEEITFSLKVPTKEGLASIGRRLEPEFTLKYEYAGVSMRYVPILGMGEKISERDIESTQTWGPIHVDIDTDEWVREGDILPVYVDIEDVINSESEIVIRADSFRFFWNKHIERSDESGRCDFDETDVSKSSSFGENCKTSHRCYALIEDITLPLGIPFVCALKVNDIEAPMVKGLIGAEYQYTYEVVKTKRIEVETELFG